MMQLPFLPNPVGPPWLPASVAEARKFAYYGVLFVFIIMLLMFVLAIVTFIFAPGFAISVIVMLVISALILFLIKTTVFDAIDQGRFNDASTFMLIWGVIGLIAAFIPGLLIIIGFIKLQEVFQTPYQQYQAQPGQVPPQPPQQQAPPQQYQQEPQYQAPPAEEQKKEKVDMVKCKNCGVQYPAFMHHCPNCNTPR